MCAWESANIRVILFSCPATLAISLSLDSKPGSVYCLEFLIELSVISEKTHLKWIYFFEVKCSLVLLYFGEGLGDSCFPKFTSNNCPFKGLCQYSQTCHSRQGWSRLRRQHWPGGRPAHRICSRFLRLHVNIWGLSKVPKLCDWVFCGETSHSGPSETWEATSSCRSMPGPE